MTKAELIAYLRLKIEQNEALERSTPLEIGYRGVYVGKVHAYKDILETLEENELEN